MFTGSIINHKENSDAFFMYLLCTCWTRDQNTAAAAAAAAATDELIHRKYFSVRLRLLYFHIVLWHPVNNRISKYTWQNYFHAELSATSRSHPFKYYQIVFYYIELLF